jgi:hypothetical protein
VGEDQGRVRNAKAAFALSLFRRAVVSFAQAWLEDGSKTQSAQPGHPSQVPKTLPSPQWRS